MSSVYVLEPPTKGKVILQTSYGPLDVELWPKEAPKAVRNFVQLCLEGYFDNTIFHRIIKSFLVQGGDPTGTGAGGESIYGGVFPDEFHSRLRFNHRGLVACANAGLPHSNGSQFFISLDRCDWLDKKNTIFGKVTGDSIYNLLRLGDVETDKNDRPLDPAPSILYVEVLWSPFDDLEPRVPLVRTLHCVKADTERKEPKIKPLKMLNLLSFGEEAEEEEHEFNMVKQRIKSSHDVLDDPRLLKDGVGNKELIEKPSDVRMDGTRIYARESLSLKQEVFHKEQDDGSSDSTSHSDDDDRFDAQMRQQIIRKRKELGDLAVKQMFQNGRSSVRDDTAPVVRTKEDEASEDTSGLERLFMKRKGVGSEARAERMVEADVDLQLLNEAERGRRIEKQKKRRLQGRQDEVLEKLGKFKKGGAVRNMSSSTNGKIKGGDEDVSDWRSSLLKFAPDSKEDGMSRREDPNDYVVKDPLMEKGKEKFNRMQARQKRREREWAGRSLT